jgi:hypothetical protein
MTLLQQCQLPFVLLTSLEEYKRWAADAGAGSAGAGSAGAVSAGAGAGSAGAGSAGSAGAGRCSDEHDSTLVPGLLAALA